MRPMSVARPTACLYQSARTEQRLNQSTSLQPSPAPSPANSTHNRHRPARRRPLHHPATAPTSPPDAVHAAPHRPGSAANPETTGTPNQTQRTARWSLYHPGNPPVDRLPAQSEPPRSIDGWSVPPGPPAPSPCCHQTASTQHHRPQSTTSTKAKQTARYPATRAPRSTTALPIAALPGASSTATTRFPQQHAFPHPAGRILPPHSCSRHPPQQNSAAPAPTCRLPNCAFRSVPHPDRHARPVRLDPK